MKAQQRKQIPEETIINEESIEEKTMRNIWFKMTQFITNSRGIHYTE